MRNILKKLAALVLSGVCLMGTTIDVQAAKPRYTKTDEDGLFGFSFDIYGRHTEMRVIFDRQNVTYLGNIHDMTLATNYKVVRDGKIISLVPNDGSKMLVKFVFDESKGTGYVYNITE